MNPLFHELEEVLTGHSIDECIEALFALLAPAIEDSDNPQVLPNLLVLLVVKLEQCMDRDENYDKAVMVLRDARAHDFESPEVVH